MSLKQHSRVAIIPLFIVLFLWPCCLQAQSVEELKKRKDAAMKNLQMTSSLITENQETTSKTLTRVNLLSAEIKQHRTIINALNAEVNEQNRQLSRLREEVGAKQKELDALRQEYAALAYHQYFKKSKYDKLMFVLSAGNLAESYRRYRYIKQYAESCKHKAEEIKQVQAELQQKQAAVEALRLQRMELLNARKRENAQLQSEQNKQKSLVTKLRKEQKELKKELKKQQQIADRLNAQIEKKIAEEARKASQKSDGKAGTYALTKEEKLISGNFEKNQGRLPWPVERGVVVGNFGIQPHAVLEHVTTNNKGIYIQSPADASARAVFEGEVTQCFSIPGSNNAVIIKHGLYRTVYANLTTVSVKVGDKVKPKQVIGKIYSDPEEDNKTVLYFQVWKDKSIHNPELWLAR